MMTSGLQTSDGAARTATAEAPAPPSRAQGSAKGSAAPARLGLGGFLGRAALAGATWIPVLLALAGASVFLVLFLMTTSARLWVPFNLEWMEDHTARQALRFAQNLPLYPADVNTWVPYMYTPLFHMALGTAFKLTGYYELGAGRVISLISTFGIVLGLMVMVRSHTRQLFPAILAGLLYFAYFKPSGYWYDLVRADSMALFLCVWGMHFTLKRNPSTLAIGLGTLLLALATLTKQSVGPAAVLASLWPILTNPRRARVVVLPIALLLLNAIMLFEAAGNEKFRDYTIFQPLNHGDNTTVWWPGYKDTKVFQESLKDPSDKIAVVKEYWRRNQDDPAWVWKDFGANVWIFALLMALWPICAAIRKKIPWGAAAVIPTLALIWGGLEGLAKAGGFNNNLMPCFVGVSLFTGFAAAELRNAFPRRAWALPNTAICIATLAQLFQPWSLPVEHQVQSLSSAELARLDKRLEASAAASTPTPENSTPEGRRKRRDEIAAKKVTALNMDMYTVRSVATGKIKDPDRLKMLVNYFNELDAAARDHRPISAEVRANFRNPQFLKAWALYEVNRFSIGGLPWRPTLQIPPRDHQIAYDWILAWLKMKSAQKEPVWVAHDQWIGSLTGHPTGLDVDMIRAAQYASIGAPTSILEPLRNQSYDWLILDSVEATQEYATGEEMRQLIIKNYEPMGVLPVYKGLIPNALFPMTGFIMRPYTLYRAKRSSKPVGDPFSPKAAATPADGSNPSEGARTQALDADAPTTNGTPAATGEARPLEPGAAPEASGNP